MNNGLLCSKGRFGFSAYLNDSRLTKPLIRQNGELVETTFKEAFLYVARRAQSIQLLHGPGALGVSISERYTNEEIYMAKKFGNVTLGTSEVFSFGMKKSPLADMLPFDASPNLIDELASTQVILAIGGDFVKDYTIAALKIKEAVDKGAKLIQINHQKNKLDDWAAETIQVENDLTFLKEIAKYLIDNSKQTIKAEGLEAFKESLEGIHVSEAAEKVGLQYLNAKKAMIVYDGRELSADGERLIVALTLLSGHIGSAREGFIKLRANANSQGLVDLGIQTDSASKKALIASGVIKGLMLFGEDVSVDAVRGLEFLMVQDTHLTEVAKLADVVIPAAVMVESNGTITSAERRIQRVKGATPSPFEYGNWEIFKALMNVYSTNCHFSSHDEITEALGLETFGYEGVKTQLHQSAFWPIGAPPQLYSKEQLAKVAQYSVTQNDLLFDVLEDTNLHKRLFEAVLESAKAGA